MTVPVKRLASPNYATVAGTRPVRGIVLHDVEGSLAAATAVFQTRGNASAHYVIDEDGSLSQFVNEQDVAFHVAAFGATPSLNRNRPSWLPPYNGLYSAVNAATIGIELVGYAAVGYTSAQYRMLGTLVCDLCQWWHLTPTYEPDAGVHATIVSHGFLQTDRTDPGPHFDWKRLKAAVAAAAPQPPTPLPTPQELAMLMTEEERLKVATTIWALADEIFTPEFAIPKAWLDEYMADRYRGRPRGGEIRLDEGFHLQEFEYGVACWLSGKGVTWSG